MTSQGSFALEAAKMTENLLGGDKGQGATAPALMAGKGWEGGGM